MEGRRLLRPMFGPEQSQLPYVEMIWVDKDQGIGALILLGSLAGIGIYTWLLIFYATVILQLTAFVAVALILGILAWIGWTMATIPPPEPIEAQGLIGASDTTISSVTHSPSMAQNVDPAAKDRQSG